MTRNLGHFEFEISLFSPTSTPDSWSCNIGTDGRYSVEVLCKKIDEATPAITSIRTKWLQEVSLKVICFLWRENGEDFHRMMHLSLEVSTIFLLTMGTAYIISNALITSSYVLIL